LYDQGKYSSLKDILDNASRMTKAKGSSTCVMAEIDEEDPHLLRTCNLGDSAYMLLRPQHCEDSQPQVKFEKLFRSESQQHRFNAPF